MVQDTSSKRRLSPHRPLWISNQVSFWLLLYCHHASLIWLLQCCRRRPVARLLETVAKAGSWSVWMGVFDRGWMELLQAGGMS